MLTKYEKIAICAVIFLLFFPFTCLVMSEFMFECLLSQITTGFLVTFFVNLLGGGLMLLFLFSNLIAGISAALIGLILLFIPYYAITNKIFQEPHKKRKILIGFILIYLIINQIIFWILSIMGIGPH